MKEVIISVPKKGEEFKKTQFFLFKKGIKWVNGGEKEEIKDYSSDEEILLIINNKKEMTWARKKQNISIEYIAFKRISYMDLRD